MENRYNKYESILFEIAPWIIETAKMTKTLNNSSFMRGRSGWIQRGIENPESIYEHDVKVALASHYLFGTNEAIAMGFAHELPEIKNPDYTPGQISGKEKYEIELSSMEELSQELPRGQFWLQNWLDFEDKKGIGKQIFELDKICPVIECIDLLKTYKDHNLEGFYSYARKQIETPGLRNIMSSMWNTREQIPAGEAYDQYFDMLKSIEL